VILGHLIPAGTAFKKHLNIVVKKLAEPVVERQVEPEEAHAMMEKSIASASELAETTTVADQANPMAPALPENTGA